MDITGFEQFMKWISHSPILALIVDTILVLIFLITIWKNIKKKIIEDENITRDRRERIEKLEEAYKEIPDMKKDISQAKAASDRVLNKLNQIENDNKKREMRKLQNALLENYRLYADINRNPMQAWSKMEANAFWDLFEEYEAVGGDGFMHSEVQPAMQKLIVIPMNDLEKLEELMHSRKS